MPWLVDPLPRLLKVLRMKCVVVCEEAVALMKIPPAALKLLIVLSVDVGEVGGEILEQGRGDGAAADERARLSIGLDFALDEQLAVFDFEAGGVEQAADRGVVPYVEDAGDACAGFSGADHFIRCAAAEEEAQSVDDDRLAAAGFAGEEVEAGVEVHAQPLDDGVVFDDELEEH